MKESRAWLMLVNSVSGDNKTARMRLWRALKATGAAALRDGVYVLPNSAAARAVFQEQAEAVIEAGGTAHIFSSDSESDKQQREWTALFDRSADYAEVFSRLDHLKSRVAKFDEVDARRQLSTLRREVASLTAIDFFPGAARRQIEAALADAEVVLNARFSPEEPHAVKQKILPRKATSYRGRTWATRERVWIDRVASAWLIRRFIDQKAKFLWLKKPRDCPKSTVGFDFDGAEFTHVGARVTFEVLAASFGLDGNAAITRLGAMVHYLDIGGIPIPEAAGFATVMTGFRAERVTDDELLKRASVVLDALYAGFAETPGDVP